MLMFESDVEIQRRGLVTISWNVGYFPSGMFDRKFYKAITSISKNALPFRQAANHHCYSDYKEIALTHIMFMFMSKEMKTRYKGHSGSAAECLFKLMTFGINPDILPVNMEGVIDYQSHHEWVQKRREIENGVDGDGDVPMEY